MIFMLIQVLTIAILTLILTTLFLDEKKKRENSMHAVKLKGYWDGGDRRGTDRLNIALDVRYTNGKSSSAKSMNLSTKGIRLLLDERLKKGTPLYLEIKLPGEGDIVKAQGEVVWCAESLEDEKDSEKRLFNTGIKFYKFPTSAEKSLFNFIHNLQP